MFPESVHSLPKTDLFGANVCVLEGDGRQVLFIELDSARPEVTVPTHTHDVEWGFVVEGEIVMTIDGRVEHHTAGSTHWIGAGVPHSFRFRPGTASVHYFVERRVKILGR